MRNESVKEEMTTDLTEKAGEPKKINGKMGVIIAAAAVLVALIAGISIYNTPANRLTRLLDLGNRYLEEENYEQAAVAFNQAIAIDDRCMEAYAGGIKAYRGIGDQEGLTGLYDRALDVTASLEETELTESMEAVVFIYLAADDVYSNNPVKVIEILEEGLTRTGDEQIREELVEDYLELAEEYTDEGNYEDALDIYDRLLELDGENETVRSDLGHCLEEYLDSLLEQGRFDDAKELIEKYRNKADNVDFEAYLNKIEEQERIEAENIAFMQKVHDLMAAEDYEAMHGVDGSEEARAFVERMEGDSYIYLPEGNNSLTGMGAGVYKFGEGGYYFCYGNLADGSREGSGTLFLNRSGERYDVFTGQWQNDAPNGEGKIEVYNGQSYNGNGMPYSAVINGNLINGLWDGPVDYQLYYGGYTFDMSYTAVNGIPQEDRTDEFMNTCEYIDLEEGEKIYAFDKHGDWWWWSHWKPGEKVGVAGFTD